MVLARALATYPIQGHDIARSSMKFPRQKCPVGHVKTVCIETICKQQITIDPDTPKQINQLKK